MTQEYWQEYYAMRNQQEPSNFAYWVRPRILGDVLYDIGSGDGRDTFFFNETVKTVGIDPAGRDVCQSFEKYAEQNECKPNSTVYARWFLHTVPEDIEDLLLTWTSFQLFIEAREAKGDHPDNHYRRPIDMERLLAKLQAMGYLTYYASRGYGFSVQGDDDPYLLRVEARKA